MSRYVFDKPLQVEKEDMLVKVKYDKKFKHGIQESR